MRNGDRDWGRAAAGDDEDPVVAYLFGAPEAEASPAGADIAATPSRTISRLRNRRGALYLPTLGPGGSTAR